jgi:6-phospho-beta-glucosidase
VFSGAVVTRMLRITSSLAEHKAISLLRKIDPEAKIGPVCAIQVVYPQSSRSEDVLAAANAEELMEFYLLDMSVYGTYPPYVASYLKSHGLYPHTEPEDVAALQASKPDFIGINYYFSLCVKAKTGPINYDQPPFWVSDAFDICENPYLEKTEWMDKGIDPAGLHIGMRKVYNRYRLPMIVTENGMAYSEAPGPDGQIHDVYRIDYLRRHIEQLEIMLDEGLPVFGYCPWSFVDVVSSHQGFAKRYGLVYVNRTDTDVMDCARIKKDSFSWYQQVIRQNGLWES